MPKVSGRSARSSVAAPSVERAAAGAAHHDEIARSAAATALLEERIRLAGDLHDGVTQRVIATSMSLAAMADAAPIDLRQRLDQLIQWQDEIVRELRSTIFALQTDHQWATSAAQELTRVVDQSAPSLGFRPTLRLHGTLELIDCAHHLGHLVFVLREMLSNVARHARATRVAVTIRVDAGRIELRVDDDGCGTNSTTQPGNGIANLTRRARMLGGTCRIGPARCGGTSVQWSIPVTT